MASLLVRVAGQPPFAYEVIALEEDTSLILSTAAEARDIDEHPIRLMTALYDDQEPGPGTVLDRGGRPRRLFAVVHDLEREPSTCDAWIAAALRAVLAYCARHEVAALALDPLGSVHGKRSLAAFMDLFRDAEADVPQCLERIWIREPPARR